MDQNKIEEDLRLTHLLKPEETISWHPLTGGVSSDIWLLKSESQKLVIKQALPQLKVEKEWKADVRRNLAEQDFNDFLNRIAPQESIAIRYANRRQAYFLMPYLGPPWTSWKSLMLNGVFDLKIARRAATLLAKIHNASYRNIELTRQFANQEDFYKLRLEPYLVATALAHPVLGDIFEKERVRIQQTQLTLMHGDFSPKNIMINQSDIVLLDHEVACFGDPAFDVAFFINHLMLKSLIFPDNKNAEKMALQAWDKYFTHLSVIEKDKIASDSARLWLMLMLARVDGKSPVEYLSERQKDFIREFVHFALKDQLKVDFYKLHETYINQVQKFQH